MGTELWGTNPRLDGLCPPRYQLEFGIVQLRVHVYEE